MQQDGLSHHGIKSRKDLAIYFHVYTQSNHYSYIISKLFRLSQYLYAEYIQGVSFVVVRGGFNRPIILRLKKNEKRRVPIFTLNCRFFYENIKLFNRFL